MSPGRTPRGPASDRRRGRIPAVRRRGRSDGIRAEEVSSWFLSAPGDDAEAAGSIRDLLVEACRPGSVLGLGSGGGDSAFHPKRRLDLTLVDRSPGMPAVSRALDPEYEHVVGEMRSVRLDRTFDAVLIHDAVTYVTSEADLARSADRPGRAFMTRDET